MSIEKNQCNSKYDTEKFILFKKTNNSFTINYIYSFVNRSLYTERSNYLELFQVSFSELKNTNENDRNKILVKVNLNSKNSSSSEIRQVSHKIKKITNKTGMLKILLQ